MNETSKRRRTVTSSLNEISKDQLGNRVALSEERYSAHPHPFLLYSRARADPVFVNHLRSSGIDSQPGGTDAWYRFLGSLNVYQFELRILDRCVKRRERFYVPETHIMYLTHCC
jgi:hypothetical protein